MNKNLIYSLLALTLAGCSANDLSNKNEENGGIKVENIDSYVNFQVVSTPITRADAQYQNGSTAENAVTRVRFYFFNAEGQPAPVWENKGSGNNSYNSYLDWYPSESDVIQTSGNSVEKVYSVTLGLALPSILENSQPASVLAVLNPPSQVLALTGTTNINEGAATLTVAGPSLENLRTYISDFYTGMTTSGNFVMTNSVYVENGNIIDATIITESNYGATEEDAEQTPITIYVERILSRIDILLQLDETKNEKLTVGDNTYYKVGSYKVYDGTNDQEVPIYAELLGWNVTGVTTASRLVKKISSDWDDSSVLGTNLNGPWNSADYHRSFWAVNPEPDNFGYIWGDFNGTPSGNNYAANAKLFPTGDTPVSVYAQENANPYKIGNDQKIEADGPAYPTKVIIAAKLVDAQGQDMQLAEWNYYKYTLPQMKIRIAQTLSNLYKRSGDENSYTYSPILPNDFTFATAYDLKIEDNDEADYYVYPILTPDAEKLTWTLGEGTDASVLTPEAVNIYMRDAINHVMVWNNGLTYYYFDIQHLGAEDYPAYYGLVRNHVYRSTIKSITGLGTPVYDPTETIYPQDTESGDNIVTTDIKILQWRLVLQDYNLTWP